MSEKPDYTNRFRILRKLFIPFIIGIPFLIIGAVFAILENEPFTAIFVGIGLLTAVPFYVFAHILTILHWKDRYIGNQSTLWGVLILIETSGWSKIVYFFRHILTDMKQSGRYKPLA